MIKHIKTQNIITKLWAQSLYKISVLVTLLCCATSLAPVNSEGVDSSNAPSRPIESKSKLYKELLEKFDRYASNLQQHYNAMTNLSKDKHTEMINLEHEKYEQMVEKYNREIELLRGKIHQLLEEQKELAQLYCSNLDLYKQAEQKLALAEREREQADQELRMYRAINPLLCFPLSSLSRLVQRICS